MPNAFFDNPPVLQGDERAQLQQLYNYLGIMSGKLNEALMQVETGSADVRLNVTSQTTQTSGGGSVASSQSDTGDNYFKTLRSMIVKTAKMVRTDMDEISAELTKSIEAQSEQFGTLVSETKNEVLQTAEGFVQTFRNSEVITSLEKDRDEANVFINDTSSYIFVGIIGTDDFGKPITGIAIGEGITHVDEHGNREINNEGKCATFTMDELAFWRGETKLAWFDSERFYINNGEVRNSLKIGKFAWRAMADGSMTLVR